ncbi:MAG TPA: 3'-5' exonuclease [Pyrinomonadaceae bacterium]|nr:3'-5' exonuclease [Pyrinomonadaceae bacterium]
MLYTTKQTYTPPLHPHEFNERALIVDTETVGAGPQVEIVEIAVGDTEGRILFDTLISPTFNRLPPPSKHHRFERAEFDSAPQWPEVWPQLSALFDGRLLIAYNAAFDRRAVAATCSRYAQATPERGWRCALPLVRRALGARRSPTLEEACARFGITGGAHRAAADVIATRQLLARLLAAGAGPAGTGADEAC